MIRLISLLLLFTFNAFAIPTMPNDQYKVGKASSTADKGFIFDTGDGVLNPSLEVTDTKSLIYSDNVFRIGDGSSANSKSFIFDATGGVSLDWNGTDNYVELKTEALRVGAGADNDIIQQFDIGNGATNPAFKYDSTAAKITFSHDGSTYQNIGSGGGGGAAGVNIIVNADFEEGYNVNWTCTSGKCSEESVAPINGGKSLIFTPTVQNDEFVSDLAAIQVGLMGNNCEAAVKYIGGDENLTAQVINGDSEVVAEQVLKAHSTAREETFYFICPTKEEITADSDKGNLQLKVINEQATVATVATFDDMHLGSNRGVASTAIGGTQGWWVSQQGNALTKRTTPVGFDLGTASPSEFGSGVFTVANDGSNITVFTALKACTLDVSWFATTSGAGFYPTIYKNGSFFMVGGGESGANQNGITSAEVPMDVGDYIELGFANNDPVPSGEASNNTQLVMANVVGKPLVETQSLVYKDIPKTSDIVNDFGAIVANSGSATITSQHIANPIASVNRTAAGVVDVVFTSGFFTVAPKIDAAVDSPSWRYAGYGSLTASGVTIYTSDDNSSTRSDVGFSIGMSRQGADVKTETTRLVLVNQVETSYKSGVTSESCLINNNGTATVDTASGLCAGWVGTTTRSSIGLVRVQFVSGSFALEPLCTCGVPGVNYRLCDPDFGQTHDNTEMSFHTSSNTGTQADLDFVVNCKGAR